MAANQDLARGQGARVPADGTLALTVRDRLRALLVASDELGEALIRRDHDAIVAAVASADTLVTTLGGMTSAVDDARAAGMFHRIDPELERLRDALRTAARRNARLIERAWQTDAATLRLLAGLGRQSTATGPGRAYASAANPTYLDTPA
jgi:hypothetical protein